jgi:microcin C transport system substrate-binding protein
MLNNRSGAKKYCFPLLIPFLVLCINLFINKEVFADYSIAYGYTPKYLQGFKHFDYVNPEAPKGGKLNLSGFNTFDRLNPFLLKGVAADGIDGLIYETLMQQSLDEPYSFYGLLADDVEIALDGLSVRFRMNPEARFSDGQAVNAEDVKSSFDILTTNKHAHPIYGIIWDGVKDAVIIDKQTIQFNFKQQNPKLPMLIAQLSVFPTSWAGGSGFKKKGFEKTAMKTPIGSGPYLLKSYDIGKQIVFQRNPDYWGRELGVRKGLFNFDEIVYKYYRDSTITLEALKAGEFDFRAENNSKMWARDYNGSVFKSKKIIKENIINQNSVGIQGFVFNTRRDKFKDKRVREALVLAYDFEWANRMLFYNQYKRNYSYFSNTELAATELISPAELALLEPYRDILDPRVFTTPWKPPTTLPPASLRQNLRQAIKLLNEAGWKYKEGALRNNKGEPFTINLILAQKAFERIAASYARNLEKLGITLEYRTVDFALYKRRVETRKFDMIVTSYPQEQTPGIELKSRWHSSVTDVDGSSNYPGISHPAVDGLLEQIGNTQDRSKIINLTRALDRVLLYEFYLVPHWFISSHRIAYWDKFERPKNLPFYFGAESWMLSTWWFKPEYRKISTKEAVH